MGEGRYAPESTASDENVSVGSLGTSGGMTVDALKYMWERRTTVLGYVVVVLGILASSNKFTTDTVEWFLLINGIVTAVLGHYNNSKIKAAQSAAPVSGEEEQ